MKHDTEIEAKLAFITQNALSVMFHFTKNISEFSKITGIPISTIYKYQADTVKISLANLLKISRAFGILPERLASTDGSLNDAIDKIKKDKNLMSKIEERK